VCNASFVRSLFLQVRFAKFTGLASKDEPDLREEYRRERKEYVNDGKCARAIADDYFTSRQASRQKRYEEENYYEPQPPLPLSLPPTPVLPTASLPRPLLPSLPPMYHHYPTYPDPSHYYAPLPSYSLAPAGLAYNEYGILVPVFNVLPTSSLPSDSLLSASWSSTSLSSTSLPSTTSLSSTSLSSASLPSTSLSSASLPSAISPESMHPGHPPVPTAAQSLQSAVSNYFDVVSSVQV
jgi:hypothetical protein